MPSAARTCVSFANFSQISEPWLKIAPGLDAAQVSVVTIGTNDVLAFAEGLVRDHVDVDPDRADGAALGAERLDDLGVFCGAEVFTERREELHLVQAVVAAAEGEHVAPLDALPHPLRRRPRVDSEDLRDVFDRALT